MNLAGKDYFTIAEAAHYCCVSESHFCRKVRAAGLMPGKLWGKLIYRKSDLARMIEQQVQWPHDTRDEAVRIPAGRRTRMGEFRNLRPRGWRATDDPLDRFRTDDEVATQRRLRPKSNRESAPSKADERDEKTYSPPDFDSSKTE